MWAHPGKKLLFMGGEFGQRREWNHDRSLDWHLLEDDRHGGVQRWVEDLNRLYRAEPALHEIDFDGAGFEWIDASDVEASVLCYLRKARDGSSLLIVLNFTPMPRHELPRRRPAARALARVPEQRRAALRRQRGGQLRRRRLGAGRDPRPIPGAEPEPAAAGHAGLQARKEPGVKDTGPITPIDLPDGRIRVIIENIQPAVDGGRFPVKRIAGDTRRRRGRLLCRRPRRRGLRTALAPCRRRGLAADADAGARQRPLAGRVRRRRDRPLAVHGARLGRPVPVLAARLRAPRRSGGPARRGVERRQADRRGGQARRQGQGQDAAAGLGQGAGRRGRRRSPMPTR